MADLCSTLANCQAEVTHERASEQGLIIVMGVLSFIVGGTLLVFACTRPWGIFFLNLSIKRGEPQQAGCFELVDLERQDTGAPSSTVLWYADEDIADDAAWSGAGADDSEWEQVAVYGGSSAVMRATAEDVLKSGVSSGPREHDERRQAAKCTSPRCLPQMPSPARSPSPVPSAAGVRTRSGSPSLGSFRRRAFSDSQVRRSSGEHAGARYSSLELMN